MSEIFHEAIYIKGDDRQAIIDSIRYDVWGRLVEPDNVPRSKTYLHLSEPLEGWMQLYYRRPDTPANFVNAADRVLDTAWKAVKFPEPAVRVFEDSIGSYSFHFSVGGLEFASIEKSAMRAARLINQVNDIDEQWQTHPFTLKVIKQLGKYSTLEAAILANPPKINYATWNTKKYGQPPKEVVNIDRNMLFKGFNEWEILDFNAVRFEKGKRLNPRERNQRVLEQFGRETERIFQVPYYWEPEEEVKGKE